MNFKLWLAETVLQVDVKKLYAWEPKLVETITNVQKGLLSHSQGKAVLVSRLDSPRGAFWVMDGHHRVVEAIQGEISSVEVEISEHVPRIERTGGAYRDMLAQKVHIYDFVSINFGKAQDPL